ncbi:MAG: NAD(P)-dependent glycerol-3-phosphate dehydrogenase [Candidatus Omnitrophica bacterium]|nr:NAD(P)-dependent glycerol-3-phosphate dehydrogenase [Candidatus Omnitrophota bacterium]
MNIAVIGDGGWGTTLAILLCGKGMKVSLWGAFPDYIKTIKITRENVKFLPGVILPDNITIVSDVKVALNGAEVVVLAVPSQYMREVLLKIKKDVPKGALIVSVSKGIENKTLMRMSEVIFDVLGKPELAVLSGPSISYEVAREIPTTVVAVSKKERTAKKVQDIFITEKFRVYTGTDIVGVELGGALKNVVAIAAGICDGMGFGANAKAALLTRGLVEIARLGATMGAKRETFYGLSGLGDLVTTCVSPHGRNRWFGEEIGKGRKRNEIESETEMVIEGIATAKSAYELAKKHKVDMPITGQIYSILYESKNPKEAVKELMTRQKKAE